MKRIVLLTLLCIVVSFGSLNANEASKSSLTFSIIGSSNYVGNQGFTFLNKPVIIASCQYGYGNVYAGIAAVASPYEGFDSDGGDELDLYVGAKFKIGKLGILDLGYVYYGNSPFSLYVGDLHGIGGTFKMACGAINPFAGIEFLVAADSKVLPGGIRWFAGLNNLLNLSTKLELSSSATLHGNNGLFGTKPEAVGVGGLSSTLSYKITDRLSFAATVAGQIHLSHQVGSGFENKASVGAGFIWVIL